MSASTPKPAIKQIDRRRRRHPRFRADFRVTVSYLLGNQYQKLDGHCRDLSEAGIGILLADGNERWGGCAAGVFVAGVNVRWELRAVVRYRRGYQYGFEFLSLTEAAARIAVDSYFQGLEPLD